MMSGLSLVEQQVPGGPSGIAYVERERSQQIGGLRSARFVSGTGVHGKTVTGTE